MNQYMVMTDPDHYLGYVFARDINDALKRAQRLFYNDVYVVYVDEEE